MGSKGFRATSRNLPIISTSKATIHALASVKSTSAVGDGRKVASCFPNERGSPESKMPRSMPSSIPIYNAVLGMRRLGLATQQSSVLLCRQTGNASRHTSLLEALLHRHLILSTSLPWGGLHLDSLFGLPYLAACLMLTSIQIGNG